MDLETILKQFNNEMRIVCGVNWLIYNNTTREWIVYQKRLTDKHEHEIIRHQELSKCLTALTKKGRLPINPHNHHKRTICPYCGNPKDDRASKCHLCTLRLDKPRLGTGKRQVGKRINSRGYVLIFMPNHPHANSGGYVFEHRLVIENHLGRYLLSTEHIHHINKIRSDNRLDNLAIVSNGEHQRLYHNAWCTGWKWKLINGRRVWQCPSSISNA